MGEDDFEQLRRGHFRILREAIEGHHGREVKNLGDGLMVVFSSASDAVSCAMAMQNSISVRTRRLPGGPLGIRIGVHAGEAIQVDADYFGTPVVVAKRLCDLAEAGEILASRLVEGLVGTRRRFVFDDLGGLRLKGLSDPFPAVRVRWQDEAVDRGATLPSPLARSHSARFVGRARESELLARALGDAEAGRRRLVLIGGEPGVGKTRLAAEFAGDASETGAVVAFGHVDEYLGLPYQPWTEALTYLVAHTPVELLRSHVDEHGLTLARLVPDLTRISGRPPPDPSSDSEADRYLLWGAVVALLELVSVEMALVIVFDDLHWADRSSVNLLRHVTRSGAALRVLFVITYRDSDLSQADPFSDALAAFHREEGIERIALSGLSEPDVVALVEDLAGHDLDSAGIAFARVLHRDTFGNPFFAKEVLRHLVDTGVLSDASDRWTSHLTITQLALPTSVREVIRGRVTHLGEPAARLLHAAAVIGREFDLRVLAAIVPAEEDELLDALDVSVRAALIHEAADDPGRFRFAHALVQQSIYADMSGARRQRLHHRAAKTLEEIYGDDPRSHAGELAHHWIASLPAPEALKGAEYAALAGEQALIGLAPGEALRWFNQACNIVAEAGAAAVHARILAGLGEAQRQMGDPAYRQTLLDAVHRAHALGDIDLLVRASLANYRGFVGRVGHVDPERIWSLEVALTALGQADRPERARLLATLAAELAFTDDYDRRRALADEAVTVARRCEDSIALLDVLTRPYLALAVPWALESRLARSAEAIALAETTHQPVSVFWAHHYGAMDALEAGDLATMDRRLDVASALATRLQQPFVVWANLRHRSLRALLGGSVDEAEELANKAFDVGTESGEPDAAVLFGGQIAAVRHHQGRIGELAGLMSDAAEGTPAIAAFKAALAFASAENGDCARAQSLLGEALAVRFEHPCDVDWLATMTIWADVAVQLCDREAAAILRDLLLPWQDRVAAITTIVCYGAVAHYLGRLHTLLGAHDEALEQLRRALAVHQTLQSPFFVAATELALGRLVVGLSPKQGQAHLDQASMLATRHGYAGLMREVEGTHAAHA